MADIDKYCALGTLCALFKSLLITEHLYSLLVSTSLGSSQNIQLASVLKF